MALAWQLQETNEIGFCQCVAMTQQVGFLFLVTQDREFSNSIQSSAKLP